jgi:hypothetical protein
MRSVSRFRGLAHEDVRSIYTAWESRDYSRAGQWAPCSLWPGKLVSQSGYLDPQEAIDSVAALG